MLLLVCLALYMSNPFIMSFFLGLFESTEQYLKEKFYKGKNIKIEDWRMLETQQLSFAHIVHPGPAAWAQDSVVTQAPTLRRALCLRFAVLWPMLNLMVYVSGLRQDSGACTEV